MRSSRRGAQIRGFAAHLNVAVGPPHLRLLRLLRDDGPMSGTRLGDRLELTRPGLLAEVDRPAAAGRVAEGDLAVLAGDLAVLAGDLAVLAGDLAVGRAA